MRCVLLASHFSLPVCPLTAAPAELTRTALVAIVLENSHFLRAIGLRSVDGINAEVV